MPSDVQPLNECRIFDCGKDTVWSKLTVYEWIVNRKLIKVIHKTQVTLFLNTIKNLLAGRIL